MPAPASESRLPVGSSANRTVGRVIRARAIATRCCWPPDSCGGPVAAALGEADAGDQRVDLVGRRPLAGDREREQDVLLRRQRREQVERLEHEADVRAAQSREVAVLHARDVLAGDPDGARGGRVEAGEQVHERRLAGARRAHDGRELAGGQVERDAAEGVDGGVAVAVRAGQRRSPIRHAVDAGASRGRAAKGRFLSQKATASSRATRERAASRAPADSRALVASASRRPTMPPDGRTDTDAWTSLPPSTGAGGSRRRSPRGRRPRARARGPRPRGPRGRSRRAGRRASRSRGRGCRRPGAARRAPRRRTAAAPSGRRRRGR